jgi:ABC-2 type transport system ATP-binding protein
MWDEIRRLRREGMTVFITTHYLEEADALCDRIAIIDHGEIVAEGTPKALKREISGDVVSVTLGASADPVAAGERLRAAADVLRSEPYVRGLEMQDDGLRLFVESGATAIPHIARVLDHAQVTLDSIEVHRPSLDDVFLAKTGRSLRES